jgi:hypothetical protein
VRRRLGDRLQLPMQFSVSGEAGFSTFND